MSEQSDPALGPREPGASPGDILKGESLDHLVRAIRDTAAYLERDGELALLRDEHVAGELDLGDGRWPSASRPPVHRL